MKRVLVMGLGRFGGGEAAARYFAERGDAVCVTDLRGRDELGESVARIEPLGVRLRLGCHDPADFESAEILVVNPAVPFRNPLVGLARRAGARIVTEIGLTLDRLPGPVVAVTGTNGKSTTASLIAAMLAASDRPAALGGNLGRPLLNLAAGLEPGTVAVLELSSFQLGWLEHDRLAPIAAVITNVTGDHLDRHPDLAHYARTKRRLVEAVPGHGRVILPAHDPVGRGFARHARGSVVWFGGGFPPPCSLEGLRLPGRHNRDNASAAAHAALRAGATVEGCERGLAAFSPLPHRLERIAERDGVIFVNDSVCTTPVATEAAVEACGEAVILLVGGRDKGLDRAPLLRAAGNAKAVVAYGETGPGIKEAFPAARLAPGLDRAVRTALDLARPGDTLLLSPGFASYDEFPGFDARGCRFRELIKSAL